MIDARSRHFAPTLALLLTAVAAAKPLHDGEIELFRRTVAIAEGLSPIATTGFEPVWIWKLAWFPVHWILVQSLFTLFGRYAPDSRRLLVTAFVLSPVVLPYVGLRLDMLASALSLSSIALFVSAVGHESSRRAAAAGALAGLAACATAGAWAGFGVLLLCARVDDRVRSGLTAGAVGVGVLAACELGAGFVLGPSVAGRSELPTGELLSAWVPSLGAAMIWAALLLLATAPLSTVSAVVAVIGVLAGFAWLHGGGAEGPLLWAFGAILTAATAGATYLAARGRPELHEVGQRRALRFLAGWLGIELAGLALLAALGDTLGVATTTVRVAVVILLFLARALTMSSRTASASAVAVISSLGIALGALFYGVDLYDATVTRTAARAGAVRVLGPTTATGWYFGEGSFAEHAERAGLSPLIPGASLVRAGERILVAKGPSAEDVESRAGLRHVGNTTWDDKVRLTTRRSVGATVPHLALIRYRPGPRFAISIYEAERDLTPTEGGDSP